MAVVEAGDKRTVAAVALQFFLNGAIYASVIPRLPEMRERLDVGVDVLGLILTIAAVAGLVGSLVVGFLIERFGSRLVMVGSALVVAGSLPVIGVANSVFVFVSGLAVWQAFDVGTDAAMNLQASRVSAARDVPIMNRMHGMWSVGTVVGGLGAAVVTALNVSLSTHLVSVGVILAAAQLVISPHLLRSDEHDPADVPMARGSLRSGLLAFFLFGAAALALELIPAEWAAFRLAVDLNTTQALAALGFVFFTTGMVSGRLVGDFVAVRVRPTVFDVGGVLLSSVGLMAASLIARPAMVMAALFIAGAGVGVIIPALYDAAARAPRPGLALGSLSAGIRFGAIVAPVLVGYLAVRVGVGIAMVVVALPFATILLTRSMKR